MILNIFVEFVCYISIQTMNDMSICSYPIMGFNCKGCFCVVPKIRDAGCSCGCHGTVSIIEEHSI